MNQINAQHKKKSQDLITNDRVSTTSIYKNTRIVLLFLIVVGTLLRFRNLGESLWLDEMLYSTKYWMTSWYDLIRLFLFDPPAPLYRVLMFFWTTLFGENEISLRMPSLLFGVLSILFIYLSQ